MNGKTTGIIVGVVAIAPVIGGALWYNNNNKDDNKDSASTSQNETAQPSSKTIVVLASETSNLSTLVTAVKAASLVDTLEGTGPYTVFAPTDSAFANLPAGTLDTLLKPENVEQLKGILTYHVVAGKVMSTDLQNGQVVKTVNGRDLKVEIMDGKVYLVDTKGGKAMVTTADVEAKNGVVHIIDAVLLPS